MNSSIVVEHVGKVYHLYSSSRDRLIEAIHPFRRKYHTDFHALSDVSLTIGRGETVGIIGKNGSGKSTLLKIITGVLTPTSGRVAVAGRISALLELGMGFNPELTGVENVFFAGAILGVSEDDMKKRLPDILEFADIGDYAMQPVKSYSSGMFVRLAFAVAIHVDPEVLIVDEALSVGDMRFQQKCYRKIRSFKEAGVTILFVSHDTGAITSFCDRCIWLKDGKVEADGPPSEVVRDYIAYMSYDATSERPKALPAAEKPEAEAREWTEMSGLSSFGEGAAKIRRVSLTERGSGRTLHVVDGGEDVEYSMEVEFLTDMHDAIYGLVMKDGLGNTILAMNTIVYGHKPRPRKKGERVMARFGFKLPRLRNGDYSISPAIAEGTLDAHVEHHWVHDATVITYGKNDPRYRIGSLFVLDEVAFNEE
jgi:ABC-type polysaccharide/polyol phosphate transport system ATPase subunit